MLAAKIDRILNESPPLGSLGRRSPLVITWKVVVVVAGLRLISIHRSLRVTNAL